MSDQLMAVQIESLVVERKTKLATKLIKSWLKANRFNKASIYQAVQWYRRLSLFKEALRLLLKISQQQSHKDPQVQLWLADCFNSIGSNHFASQILDPIVNHLSDVHDLDVAAGIYLGVGQNERAAGLFQQVVSKCENQESHMCYMAQIGLADSEVRLNKFTSAIKRVRAIQKKTQIAIVKEIARIAEGEFLARQGEVRKSSQILSAALKQFNSAEKTYDYALILKWYGFCQCKTGNRAQGTKIFAQSYQLMKKFGMGLDQWLDLLALKKDLNIINRKDEQRLNILNFYLYKKSKYNIESKIQSQKAELEIYLSSNEFRYKNKFHYSLPVELELLALLRASEDVGVSTEVIKGRLWNSEVYSYFYLQQRLFLLINRLKNKYKMKVWVQKGTVYLDKRDWSRISVTHDPKGRPTFFQNFSSFKGTDVSKYYSCKHNQRATYLKFWKEADWIEKKDGTYCVK